MATVAQPEIVPNERQKTSSRKVLAGDSLAAGIFFALVFTVGQRVIGFIRNILFCRLMTDQELGQWSIVWGFILLLPPLAMLGLPGCFGKFTEYFVQRNSGKTFIRRIGLVSGLTTASGILTLILVPEYFASLLLGDGSAIGLIICLAVALVAVSVSNFVSSALESIRQVRLVSVMRFIIVVAFTILGSLAIIVCESTVEAVTLAYGLSCLLSLFPAVWIFWRCRTAVLVLETNSMPNMAMWKKVLPFAGWMWVCNILNNSIEIVDRYMLLQYSPVSLEVAQSMVGQYHSSKIIPALLTSIAGVLGGLLLPYLSKLWEADRKTEAAQQLNATFKVVGVLFTGGGLVVLMFSRFFFESVLQGKYSEGLAVLPMTMMYCTWFSLYTVGQDYLWVAERGRQVSLALAIGLAVNILLNFLFIPTWGLWGAVLGASIGNFLVVVVLLAMNQHYGCRTDKGMWSILALPLLLLIEPIAGFLCLLLVLLLAAQTHCLFSVTEKTSGLKLAAQLTGKFRGQKSVRN
jgi:O-antigen/teichoic acid export membrane protein